MQVSIACFVLFCSWLFSPYYLLRVVSLDLDDVRSWEVPDSSKLPKAFAGLFFMSGNVQPDGSPSPMIGMDTRFCAFDAVRRHMRCPVSSMLWAPEADAISTARKLALARFHYDFVFDEKFDAAELHAYVFGIDVLKRLGLVWDIAKLNADGGQLRRCSWTAESAALAGDTPLQRVRRAGRGNQGCYAPRRVCGAGTVSRSVVNQMKQAWGRSVVRLE